MAGLIKENFKEEVLTELSWIMNVIDEITQKYGIETYESVLIRYRIQPEEERAIDKFICFHLRELDNLTIDEIRDIIANYYFEITKKTWNVSDEIVEKLIKIRRDELSKKSD